MRKYGKEFKKEAVKLSDEVGINQAVAQLGVALIWFNLFSYFHK